MLRRWKISTWTTWFKNRGNLSGIVPYSALARCGNFDPKIEGKKDYYLVSSREKQKKLFPDNVQQLLTVTYYRQFKDWFARILKDRKDWGE